MCSGQLQHLRTEASGSYGQPDTNGQLQLIRPLQKLRSKERLQEKFSLLSLCLLMLSSMLGKRRRERCFEIDFSWLAH